MWVFGVDTVWIICGTLCLESGLHQAMLTAWLHYQTSPSHNLLPTTTAAGGMHS